MHKIESVKDFERGIVRYRLNSGRVVALNAFAVRDCGAAAILRGCGYADEVPKERLPVFQDGRRVGTLPPDFDPAAIRSTTWLYDPRPGDFRRDGDRWIANRMLGPGDFEAVPGFQRDR